jgi:hypothetical protein
MLRQFKQAKTGGAEELHHKLWSGHPCTAVAMPNNIHWVDELIWGNNHITEDELCSTPSISKGSVMTTIEKLGYYK